MNFEGVDQELLESGFDDESFRLFGVTRVYIAPGSIAPRSSAGPNRFQISEDDAQRLIQSGQAQNHRLELTASINVRAGRPQVASSSSPQNGALVAARPHCYLGYRGPRPALCGLLTRRGCGVLEHSVQVRPGEIVPAHDDSADLFCIVNVFQRVCVQHHDIRDLPGLNRPQLIQHA